MSKLGSKRKRIHGPKTLKEYVRSREGKKRLNVAHERLDRGGYTSQGRYYGLGPPLYNVYDESDGEHYMVRAKDANDAREKVLTNPRLWKSR